MGGEKSGYAKLVPPLLLLEEVRRGTAVGHWRPPTTTRYTLEAGSPPTTDLTKTMLYCVVISVTK